MQLQIYCSRYHFAGWKPCLPRCPYNLQATRAEPVLLGLQECAWQLCCTACMRAGRQHSSNLDTSTPLTPTLPAPLRTAPPSACHLQLFGFMYLTWWELSWDVMEPVAYFVSLGYSLVAYMYFLYTRGSYFEQKDFQEHCECAAGRCCPVCLRACRSER